MGVNFEPQDWHFALIDYALYNILPGDPKEATSVERKTTKFYYDTVL